MKRIIIDKKEVDQMSIEVDPKSCLHESAKFVDGTPLDEEQLCHLDDIREDELTEAYLNYRRE